MTTTPPATIISKDALTALIKANAPYLYMHPNEKFMPSSFDWLLAQPNVTLGDPSQHHAVPNPLGAQNPNSFLAYPWGDSKIEGGNLDSMKTYVRTKPNDTYGAGGLEIQYWFFSPFNGPGNAEITLTLSVGTFVHEWSKTMQFGLVTNPFGEHQGDWEHISLYFNSDHQLVKITAAQHGSSTDYYPPGTHGQSTWEVENGRPVFYSSLNSHAIFASKGDHLTGDKAFDGGVSSDVHGNPLTGDVKAQLVDKCDAGARADCAANLVWVSNQIEGTDVTSPGWLPFEGRCGYVNPPMGDVTDRFKDSLIGAFESAIRPVLPGLLNNEAPRIAGIIFDQIGTQMISYIADHTDNFDGPRMPKWTD